MKLKQLRNRIVLLSSVLALVFTLSIGSIFVFHNQSMIEADAAVSVSLFDFQGNMRQSTAQAVSTALGNTPQNVLTVDRGMSFRLFPNQQEGPSMPASAVELANSYWRIVDVIGDRVTLWATNSYMLSRFQTGTSVVEYPNSLVRQRLLGDYVALQNRMPGIDEHVIPIGFVSMSYVPATDRLWLPNEGDVMTYGNWGIGIAQRFSRGYYSNGMYVGSWIRSTYVLSGFRRNVWMTAAGVISGYGMNNHLFNNGYLGIRPAVNISLDSIIYAAEYGSTNNNMGPPSGGSGNNNNNNSNNNEPYDDRLFIAIFFGSVGLAVVLVIVFFVVGLFKSKKNNHKGGYMK